MMNMKILLSLTVATAGVMLAFMSPADAALKVVEDVDLERYQGRWYEIARLPNRFQNHCVSNVSANYRLREDGRIDVINRCRREDGSWSEATGMARRARADGPDGALEVRFAPRWLSFLPFVWGDYRILALDENYEHVLVGSEDRRYLWVLARSADLPEAVLEDLLTRAREQGFDTDGLIRTRHED
ncbi:MAG: lipocalin family protein [Wenzhouxiangella sp.]